MYAVDSICIWRISVGMAMSWPSNAPKPTVVAPQRKVRAILIDLQSMAQTMNSVPADKPTASHLVTAHNCGWRLGNSAQRFNDFIASGSVHVAPPARPSLAPQKSISKRLLFAADFRSEKNRRALSARRHNDYACCCRRLLWRS